MRLSDTSLQINQEFLFN